ncbi:MAG: class II fructose-bisphosphate aldolase [Betaproteobacteria bacterium]
MLVEMCVLLRDAQARSYAVGSFDAPSLETAYGILEAAQAEKSPVIVAVPENFMNLCPFEEYIGAVRRCAEPLDIPVALLLDHGKSYETCIRAVKAGMTSVMFDGSSLPWEENVATTSRLVEYCRPRGVAVEGEIGQVIRAADFVADVTEIERHLTTASEAIEFARRTDVDALAIAVGTAHGQYRGTPRIHYDVIASVRNAIDVPLVLHGGSATGDEALQESIRHGIAKINIYTDMSLRAVTQVRELLNNERAYARYNDVVLQGRQAFREVAAHYMRVFGSSGKAEGVKVA